uniref:Uncharacterized protein n=1 Tax=Vespula pensylvanica TaxID=30213 RepID=A0A834U822_VESPE|nr:hypothetical protein H0235_010798 [Vespula pensylvanica]
MQSASRQTREGEHQGLLGISLVYFTILTSCQYQPESQQAAILSDARYLAGDGTFGSAYTQEDGVEFKEESDVNGDRRGSYSYVDPTGQRRTVTYTAGKNGFQATGDHIPVPPPQIPPQPEYVPLPQYNPPDYKPPAAYRTPAPPPPVYRSPPLAQYQTRAESEYEPRAVYQPQPQPQPQSQSQLQPQYQYRPQTRYMSPDVQSIPSFSPRPQYQPTQGAPIQRYNEITTPSPHRFYPPGKLSFNRTPDGFSYTFSKS